MTQNIVPKQQRSSSGQEVEGFRLAKSISTLKPWACLLPAKEEIEGSNPPKLKEAAVESLEKHHKRRMQKFGDVNVSQAWCSYWKQRICN